MEVVRAALVHVFLEIEVEILEDEGELALGVDDIVEPVAYM